MGKAIDQLDYFTQNDWKVSGLHCRFVICLFHNIPLVSPSLPLFCPQWSHANHDKLLSIMSEEDKQEFDFDIRSLDWDQYIHDFCMGTKQYLFKEDLANLPVARRQIKRWAPLGLMVLVKFCHFCYFLSS